jgi:predicted nucleic acid binding AN1-type Zn finger protein
MITLKNSKCQHCAVKKGLAFNCKYCKHNYCTGCIQPEVHHCNNINEVIKESKYKLENNIMNDSYIKRKLECI